MESPCNPRIKKVLDMLVDPNFKLKNDAYLNLLLTHLTTSISEDGTVTCQNEIQKQFLLDWLVEIISKWSETQILPKPHALAFTTNLLRSLCSDEEIFVKLRDANIFEHLLNISNCILASSPQHSVELALVKLMFSFLEHEAGVDWMISANHWKIVLNSALNSNTVYIAREGCKCIAKLLIAANSKNGTLCKNIVQLIWTPLIDAKLTGANDDALYKSLSPTLQLIVEILLKSLENQVCSNEKEFVLMATEEYDLEKCVKKLLITIENENFVHDLYKILIILCFFDMHFKSYNKKVINSRDIDTTVKLFDVLFDAVSKGSVTTILNVIFTSLDYWEIMEKTSPAWISPKLIDLSFKYQLMILQLLPAVSFGIEKLREYWDEKDEEDDCRSNHIQKVLDHTIPAIMRIGYKWRSRLSQDDSLSPGSIGLKYFLHSKKYYKRENAIIAFQCLTHTLIDITHCLEAKPHLIPHFLKQPEYLPLLLESITIIIEDFAITGKECPETISVLEYVHRLLNIFAWPSRVVVKGLKLADKAISRYMCPEMVLLIDNIESSIITVFATMLFAKLHDGEWEIRDSALEVIHTLAEAANKKFSSFRKPILGNDFPCVILNMALVDGSSFVRSTALKCLQEMVQDAEFRQILLTKGDIFEKSSKIVHVETEGIVRSEAAVLINCLYSYQDIPEDVMDNFYDVMTHAVVADLHWEVRVKALHFWKTVIDHHLTQQGMIDGTFPSITFSKQYRKIVNLDEDQVKKGLIEVLNQLSMNGCLAVFHAALQDQCDPEVCKYAITNIRDFVYLLQKYKITPSEVASPTIPFDISYQKDVFSPVSSHLSPDISDNPMDVTLPDIMPINAGAVLDELLDDILDSRDINLLQSVYNSYDKPTHDYIKMKGRIVLSPEEFLNFIYSNFECIAKEKVKWVEEIDNFNSLLDDILKEYDSGDVISMDCY